MGSDNLIPMNERTKEEAKELSRKGGINSGKSRRKKKLMKDIISSLGKEDAPTQVVAKLVQLGMLQQGETCSMDEALILAQYGKALGGNTRAAEFVRNTAGQKPKDEIEISDITREQSKLDEILKQRRENHESE